MSGPADAAEPRPLRVVLWGTCDTGKPRVRILRDGLREVGAEVIECRADVWGGIEDKSQVRGTTRWLGLLSRLVLSYPRLVWRYLRLPPHDWVLLGYPAIPDVFVIRLFASLRGARVAMDWFLSAYDTVVCDRRMVSRRHPLAGLLWAVEWLAARLSDLVFMDTRAHARRMEALFGLRPGSCRAVWVGAEEHVFPPVAGSRRADDAPLRVLFYGQFIPLQGVPTIIEAARLLRGAPVHWHLVGTGQDAGRARAMLDQVPLPDLAWTEWVPYAELDRHIAAADVCLGIFGTSDKAASVIPNKVFQVLSVGKPLLTRDSPAIRELLDDASVARSLVPPGDAAALADAIMRLDREGTMAATARAPFGVAAIGAALAGVLAQPHSEGPAA